MRYYNLVAFALSFAISTGVFYASTNDDVPVQHIEFEVFDIKPDIEVIEFEEMLITAQADEADDGDGENLDMMNANWCLIHPDDVICQVLDEDDEEEGC